ncbi:putative armadillo-like helical protein [Helianthus annuus]|nr:putative armadillo-like helical protein [Helianthus annuus]
MIRSLVNQGCINPLCDLLVCLDPRIVIVSLEGLENSLKVVEAKKNLGNDWKESQRYARLSQSSGQGSFGSKSSVIGTRAYK